MVQGLDRLKRRLRAIPQDVERELRPTMERTADEIVAQMKAIVARRTGRGAESIGWTWGDAPAGAVALGAVGARRGRDGLRITIHAGGGDAFYLRFIEFGTVKAPAQPFFFPVYRANRTLAKRRISAAVSRALKARRR